jgi:hypothetical protein
MADIMTENRATTKLSLDRISGRLFDKVYSIIQRLQYEEPYNRTEAYYSFLAQAAKRPSCPCLGQRSAAYRPDNGLCNDFGQARAEVIVLHSVTPGNIRRPGPSGQ